MKYQVKAEKVNSGVYLTLLNPNKRQGKLVQSKLDIMLNAIKRVYQLYTYEVAIEMRDLGVDKSGYYRDFVRVLPRKISEVQYMLDLEPWGFAVRENDGTPIMRDSGSFPTDCRAKVLYAYQKPLNCEKTKDGLYYTFSRVYEVIQNF